MKTESEPRKANHLILELLALTFVVSASLGLAQTPTRITYQGRLSAGGAPFSGPGWFKFALVDGGTNLARQATATATVNNGFIVAINVTDGGAGYVAAPAVRIDDASGSGATATTTVAGGAVTAVTVQNAGHGYSASPVITVAAPPANIVYRTYWSNDGTSFAGAEPTAAVPLTVVDGLFTVNLGDTTLSNMAYELHAGIFANPNLALRTWFSPAGAGVFEQLVPDQSLTAVPYAMTAAAAQTLIGNSLRVISTGSTPDLIGGSSANQVATGVVGATIAGGGAPSQIVPGSPPRFVRHANTISADYGTIGGGRDNSVNALGGFLGGGCSNSVQAAANNAVVPGGDFNVAAGRSSFAAGHRAKALHDGAFVWGDFTEADVASAKPDQFVIRANGGLQVLSSSAAVFGVNPAGGLTTVLDLNCTNAEGWNLVVNGQRSLRVEAGPTNAPNLIGGSLYNSAAPGVQGATISGGSVVFAGPDSGPNRISSDYGTIAGGRGNTIQDKADSAAIGGGDRNVIKTGSSAAFIGGGNYNNIETNASVSLIGGGYGNRIYNGAAYAVIGGGFYNAIRTNAAHCVVAGGYQNEIQVDADYGAILGGSWNDLEANADYSVIVGGDYNRISTNADHSIIGGGRNNEIAGNARQAVIGGGSGNDINTGASSSVISGGVLNGIQNNATGCVIGGGQQHLILASARGTTISGGHSNTAGGFAATIPGGATNIASGDYSFAAGLHARAAHKGAFVWGDSTDADIASTNANSVTFRASGGYRFFSNPTATAGVSLAAGSGSWNTMSDRNVKENLAPVDNRAVLEKVAVLPLQTWNYVSQDPAVRHLGPMAQDFAAAFQLGEDDRHISIVDAQGVALAAIQGLHEMVKARDAEIQALTARMTALEKLVSMPAPASDLATPSPATDTPGRPLRIQ